MKQKGASDAFDQIELQLNTSSVEVKNQTQTMLQLSPIS